MKHLIHLHHRMMDMHEGNAGMARILAVTGCLLLFTGPVAHAAPPGPKLIYVDQSAAGSNTGTSWSNAYTDLQSALSIAIASDTVFVATGTYKPSVGGNYSRTHTFSLTNGVVYYGGYPAGGGNLASRDFTNNRTILSGDIGVLNDTLDNCFVVVNAGNMTTSTVFSGFTVEHGNADSTTSVMYGRAGGINYGATGAMRLESVTIRNNFGRVGSGIYAEGPVNWVVQNCTLANNTNGAALYVGGTPSATFTNCAFTNNLGYNGGAISMNVLAGATFTFTNCSFTGNVGNYSGGGGAINAGHAAGTYTNCTFTNNTSIGPGGAVDKFYNDLNTFSYCTFTGNSGGGGFGGGALYGSSGGFSVDHCIFNQNFTTGSPSTFNAHGGAIYNNGGNTTVSNSVFWGNYTQYGIGGAIYNNTGGSVNLTNCSFAANFTTGYSLGGGLMNNSNSSAVISNCIFWGNKSNGTDVGATTEIGVGSVPITVANTIWQDNLTGGTIFNVNPLFTNVVTGDLRLQDCSPAIDTGVANSLTNDVLGNPRPFDALPGGLTVDLGAYERQNIILVPEIDLTGNNTAVADGDAIPSLTDHTDFGAVTLGSSLTRTFTIHNTGAGNLTITGITKTGADAALFTLGVLSPASPVLSGATADLTITFAPTATGVRNAVLHIASNDCNEADYDIAIQATAVCPVINPNAVVSPLYPMSGQEIQTIYLGYPSCAATVGITATPGGGTAPYTYAWTKTNCNATALSNYTNTTNTASFAPVANDLCAPNAASDNVFVFSVTATDAYGCKASQDKKINVVNPYADAQHTNVQICHKVAVRGGNVTQAMVVPQAQVAAHLSHGDVLGNCVLFTGAKGNPATAIPDEQKVTLYPNPTTGLFFLELSAVRERADIIITDIQGRVVATKTMKKEELPTVTFDLSSLARGMYLIQLRDGDYIDRAKIIFQ